MSSAAFNLLQGDPTTWGIPPVNKTFLGINQAGQLVTKQNDGTIATFANPNPRYSEFANVSGATDIPVLSPNQVSLLAVSGSARVLPVNLQTNGAVDAGKIELRVDMPVTPDIQIQLFDVNIGTPIATWTTDGTTRNGVWTVYFAHGQWNILRSTFPAS